VFALSPPQNSLTLARGVELAFDQHVVNFAEFGGAVLLHGGKWGVESLVDGGNPGLWEQNLMRGRRPQGMARTVNVYLRLTPAEWDRIKAMANLSGQPASVWMRTAVGCAD
jgi:hypothetical protein